MDKEQIMTTKELAEYMKLNEKTVLKMAQNKRIPGVKIGNQWRFHIAAIDHCLQRDIMHSSKNELDTIISTAEHIFPLSRLIDQSIIDLDLKSKDKIGVLLELAKIAYKAGLAPDSKKLFKELKKRENMLSTAVGNCVAIPHSRDPIPGLFRKPNIIVARSKRGIAFSAPDNKKVHLFFMTCAPNIIVHLRLLAKIAKLLQVKDIIRKFMKASSNSEVMQILLEFERRNIFPGGSTCSG